MKCLWIFCVWYKSKTVGHGQHGVFLIFIGVVLRQHLQQPAIQLCLSILLKTNPDCKYSSVLSSLPTSPMCQSKFKMIRNGFYQGSNIKEGREYLIIGFSITAVTAAFKSNFHALAIDTVYFSGKSSPNSHFYHILQIFLNEFYTLMQNQKRKEF